MTVLVVYPDAGSGGTTCDGYVQNKTDNSSFSTIRSAASGTTASVGGYIITLLQTSASTSNPNFYNMARGFATFDTSTIGSTADISSAVLDLYGQTSSIDFGDTTFDVVSASPADDNNIVLGDYSEVGSTVFSDMSISSVSTSGYNEFSLDSNGVANINKGGITRFGFRLGWDTDGAFGGTWKSNDSSFVYFKDADIEAGTTFDPKLTVTYTTPQPPTVTTQAASSINYDECTLNGTVTDIGDESVTTRGFYWLVGTTGNPTAADNIASESGTYTAGAFTQDLTSLTPGDDLRVAAFATSSIGTTIGDTVDVVIPLAVTTRGFYIKQASTGDPTAADTVVSETGTFGLGTFNLPVVPLEPELDYRVAVFVTNANGTSVGSTVGFTTLEKPVVPGGRGVGIGALGLSIGRL